MMTHAALTLLLTALLLWTAFASPATADEATTGRLPLWPEGAPGAVGGEPQDIPTIEVFLPEGADAATPAIVVCPGGGYMMLADDHEGVAIARRVNEMGVAAFVLRYRISPRYREPMPLLDAQRAIRHVRHYAERYNVDADRIGILGFSAGGHLAATTGTLIGEAQDEADDPVDRHSARPDFLVLCYPVINMTDYTVMHRGSQRALLGDNPDPAKAVRYSPEQQVSERTPPTFLFHTDADTAVVPENSVLFYLALREAGVPAELHVYQPGRHGLGLGHPDNPAHRSLRTWPDLLHKWLLSQELMEEG